MNKGQLEIKCQYGENLLIKTKHFLSFFFLYWELLANRFRWLRKQAKKRGRQFIPPKKFKYRIEAHLYEGKGRSENLIFMNIRNEIISLFFVYPGRGQESQLTRNIYVFVDEILSR